MRHVQPRKIGQAFGYVVLHTKLCKPSSASAGLLNKSGTSAETTLILILDQEPSVLDGQPCHHCHLRGVELLTTELEGLVLLQDEVWNPVLLLVLQERLRPSPPSESAAAGTVRDGHEVNLVLLVRLIVREEDREDLVEREVMEDVIVQVADVTVHEGVHSPQTSALEVHEVVAVIYTTCVE